MNEFIRRMFDERRVRYDGDEDYKDAAVVRHDATCEWWDGVRDTCFCREFWNLMKKMPDAHSCPRSFIEWEDRLCDIIND